MAAEVAADGEVEEEVAVDGEVEEEADLVAVEAEVEATSLILSRS